MFFRKKKKEEPHKGDIFLAKGIYLRKPVMNNGNLVLNCFLRSLIVFCLVFGAMGSFLSAFGISYHFLYVIVFYLLLSMYFSFLYSTAKMIYRDIGYILFFFVFVAAIYRLRLYANSGFYAIINAVLRQAQIFFNLSGIREYDTQISNDYLTIAVVAIFIGMVYIIILNIWLYSLMSLFWTVLLTFPPLLIPLYMKLVPDPLYIIFLAVGYMAVVIFKANGHYQAFAWDTPFRVRGLKKDSVSYTQNAGIFKQILLSVGVLAFSMVILVESIFPASAFARRFQSDRLQEMSADTISNFVLLGFAGLYNRYASTGGISGGKLGGVSNVRPDYEPDLIVTYAPYSNEAVYLKAYTGGSYGDNEWISIYASEAHDEVYKDESMEREITLLKEEAASGNPYSASGKMDILNVGANSSYVYRPYYTCFAESSIYDMSDMLSEFGLKESRTYAYYPKVEWEESLGEMTPEEIHTDMVDPVFLDVPEKNQKVIEEECARIGLSPQMTENEIAEAVHDYFEKNIPYTLKPGATPRNEDFINYFLTRNRKGYCAHFASAATLIFREMGIPARYVEGYAFTLEAVLASDINRDKEYADYYQGYSRIGESAVMDVEVTDAMAHAWVEIYVEDFGWKVVEVTPGNYENTDEDDFWSAFTDFFNNPGEITGGGTILGNLNLSEISWLVYVVLIGVAGVLLFLLGKMGIRKIMRYRRCHQKDRQEAVIALYADICDRIRLCHTEFDGCRSHREQLAFICHRYQMDFDIDLICNRLEQLSFSKETVPLEELAVLQLLMKDMRKTIWEHAGWKQKMALCKR